MKKILFLQIKGNSFGGVWFVNKTLGEELINRGYKVEVLALRNNHPGVEINDTPIKITTINPVDSWEIFHRKDVLHSLKKGEFFKTLKSYLSDDKKLKQDYQKMKQYINDFQPDIIISSHYQTLFGIPKKYLKKTIFVQHSSFEYVKMDRLNVKTLKKLNHRLYKMCWLCKSTMEEAMKVGLTNSTYIYNPNKFHINARANVCDNKRIVVVTRIHPEKRIDLMIDMVNDVFQDCEYNDWKFDIYGIGEFNEQSKEILKNSKQIKYHGVTNEPVEVLMQASITLNTSIYEGFSLSIIEGNTCGLPVIAFHFGESAHEQIIDGYNGFIIANDDVEAFKNKIKYLLNHADILEKMSKNAKEFSKQFEVSEVVDKWEKIFLEME